MKMLQQAEMIARRELRGDQTIGFDIQPDAAGLDELAQGLGISAVRKLRFRGEIAPQGRADWRLTGHLGATVVQPCVVTLAPVTTRVEVPLDRLYVPRVDTPEGEEVEIPAEDGPDPIGDGIDLAAVLRETLALALPDYPRADGAELAETVVTEPGKTPMRDEDARPFAALKSLRDQMGDDE